MDKSTILAMSGNKLKAEVAQRIMGIKVEYPFAEGYPYYLREDKDGKMKWDIVPDYPGDISAAWQVVEKMGGGRDIVQIAVVYQLHFGEWTYRVTISFQEISRASVIVWDKTVSEAISKAALLTRLDEKRLEE